MSQQFPPDPNRTAVAGPSEPESHIEHQAALDATIFRENSRPHEIVLELVAGQLRVRARR